MSDADNCSYLKSAYSESWNQGNLSLASNPADIFEEPTCQLGNFSHVKLSSRETVQLSPNDVSVRPQYSYNTAQPSQDSVPSNTYQPSSSNDGYADQSVRPSIQTDTYNRPDDYLPTQTTSKPMIYLDDFGLTTNNKYSTPFSYDVHTSPHYNHDIQNNDFGHKEQYPNKHKVRPNIYTLDEINAIHEVTTHRPNGFFAFGPIRTPLKNPQYEAYNYFTKFLSSLADIFTYPSVPDEPETKVENENTRQKDTHDLPLEEKSGSAQIPSNDDDSKDNTTIMFDNDGYLRPEHMNLKRLKPTNTLTLTNSTDKTSKIEEIDDFILPLLTEQKDDTQNNKSERLEPNDDFILPILNDLRNSDKKTVKTEIKRRQGRSDDTARKRGHLKLNTKHTNSTEKSPILMVPLMVLTKPERPDNWVMFHSVYKPPLPTVPLIQMGEDVASEIPEPLLKLKAIRKKDSINSNG